jgi:hypothetical protein
MERSVIWHEDPARAAAPSVHDNRYSEGRPMDHFHNDPAHRLGFCPLGIRSHNGQPDPYDDHTGHATAVPPLAAPRLPAWGRCL